MKIRYKGELAIQVPVEVDGVEPFGIGWLKRVPEDGRLLIYEPTHWEEVKPEPVWVDVTRQCTWRDEDGTPISRKVFYGLHGQYCIADVVKGYRLRKVEVSFVGKGRKNGCEPGHAFIVEKLKT